MAMSEPTTTITEFVQLRVAHVLTRRAKLKDILLLGTYALICTIATIGWITALGWLFFRAASWLL
jgi:hypothetical protein